jgi:CheY-like chemotaxis protein
MRDSTILIVEDDGELAEALAEVLDDEGYQVMVARNGSEALDRILRDGVRPGLILLDMMMPVMNGWQLKARLDELGSSIPLIVCTADGHAERKAAQVGAVGHLKKPPSLKELVAAVEGVLGRPSLDDEAARG